MQIAGGVACVSGLNRVTSIAATPAPSGICALRATRTRNLTRIKIMAEARKDAEWETMLLPCARDHVFLH